MKNLVGKNVGGICITQNMQDGFEAIEKMSDDEKTGFITILLMRAKMEEARMKKEIEDGFATLTQKMNDKFNQNC